MTELGEAARQASPPTWAAGFKLQAATALRRFAENPIGAVGAVILAAVLAAAALAPWLSPYDPLAQDLMKVLQPPSLAHLAGTDELGRDILSRLLYGARITLQTVALVSLIVGPIGLLVGMVSGYAGGRVDGLIMRFTDVILSFPSLILALVFAAALGPGLINAVVAIALTAWPPIARLARVETLIVRRAEYMQAARLYGASHARLIALYVLPMCVPSVIVRLTLNMAGIILTAAGLGFLGLGAQPPLPEWGAMIASGRRFMLDHWWVTVMPGMAILITSLAFNLVGDTLRDVLDPRHAG